MHFSTQYLISNNYKYEDQQNSLSCLTDINLLIFTEMFVYLYIVEKRIISDSNYVRVYHKIKDKTCFCANFILFSAKNMQNEMHKAIFVKNEARFVK